MKLLALYLPQFHQIKENDEWWGEGFTEWVNVKKALPLFEGHKQPRVPLNNNYYNLLQKETLIQQTELAKKYGIYGFCVYHYWFKGHLLLEKPMEIFLENKDIDLPICFCWANEHWTNAWVSGQNKILIEQDFEDRQDWINHFNYLLPFFKDERYIKEENKPLFVIYFPNIIGPLKELMECWNKLAIENGFDGIKFVFQHHLFYTDKKEKNRRELFDYGVQFQPSLSITRIYNKQSFFSLNFRTKISLFLQKRLHIYKKQKRKELRKFDYDELWKDSLSLKPSNEKYVTIPGCFVDWDNTSRRGINGSCVINHSINKFENYFDQFVKNTKKYYETDWAFIFSWNEWAEGGYLEPDEHNKHQYLEKIHDILEKNGELPEYEKNKIKI